MRGELREVRAHLVGAERAVDADAERLRVRDRVQNASIVWPESVRPLLSVMVTEMHHAAGAGRARAKTSSIATMRGLRVQRVEDRLDEEQVDAAVDQAADLLGVRRRAPRRTSPRGTTGSFDVGRDRERAVERPDRAGDEARLVGSSRVHSSAAPRASCAAATFSS